MKDPRIEKLAKILVDYSTSVKKGDVVQIMITGAAPLPLAVAVHGLCLERGAAHVDVQCSFPEIQRSFYDHASAAQLAHFPKHELDFMKKVDVYIAIRGGENSKIFASVPAGTMTARQKVMRPIQDWRVRRTRWCVLIYPTEGMAQDAGMSFDEFEDFVYGACLIDWKRMSGNMAKLQRLMSKTKEVRIVASDTDLRFTKAGIPAVKCDGTRNMPDGEVYTAPARTSVEGHIQYNTPSQYQGREFNKVRLAFKHGKIVEATCDTDNEAIEAIFNTDEGARSIGEFSLGVNQGIQRPIKSILFDEKIGGSIHFTPGAAYDECDNGNRSAIHWDLVKILKGDGEIYFDGKLIQKDGRFVLPELKPLNK
jgi:aminopeptidase